MVSTPQSVDIPTGDPQPISDMELEAALAGQIESATGFFGDQVSTTRSELLSVYLRNGYTDDTIARAEDRSDFVDSTCSDSVDQILGELIETVMGGETIASFVPEGPDDERSARQETDLVHHVFFTMNPGYLILFDWLWDGLTLINGYVKAWRDERLVVEHQTYTGQTEEAKANILGELESEGAEVEVVWEEREQSVVEYPIEEFMASNELQMEAEEAEAIEPGSVIIDQVAGVAMVVISSISFELKIKRKKESYRIESIPTDEILISPRWESVDLSKCPFVGHRYLTTESDLISEGFDPEQIRSLPTSEDDDFGGEREERFSSVSLFETDDRQTVDSSSRRILVTECYVYIDRDGDGISELIMAKVAGADASLLRYTNGNVAVEEVEEIPIHAWTPFIIPHRHHGESVVMRNQDIQRAKSVFTRQLHDNTAFSGNPRVVVGRDAVGRDTLDDLQIYRPGGIVRAREVSQVVPMKTPPVIGDVLPVLDRLSDLNEERTGATRLNQGLVSDKFGKQVAGVTIAQLRQAGLAKINMIARNFLETGFASLMRHLHALIRRHADKEMVFSLRGEWITVDPRQWGERANVKVSVGLGNEGRLVKAEVLRDIVDRQVTALSMGSVIADEQKIYNTLTDLAEVSGLKNPERYFNNPEMTPPLQQGQEPTPQELLAQSQVAVAEKQADAKVKALVQKEINDARDAMIKRAQLELKQEELMLRDDRERDKAVLEALTMISDRLTAIEARQVVSPPSEGKQSSVSADFPGKPRPAGDAATEAAIAESDRLPSVTAETAP